MAVNLIYCGKKVNKYADHPQQWCTIRDRICHCDGYCGPGDGCHCVDCYEKQKPFLGNCFILIPQYPIP